MQNVEELLEQLGQWVEDTGLPNPNGEYIENPAELSKEGAVSSLYNIVFLANKLANLSPENARTLRQDLINLVRDLEILNETYNEFSPEQKIMIGKILADKNVQDMLNAPQTLINRANTKPPSPLRFIKRSLMLVNNHLEAARHNLKVAELDALKNAIIYADFGETAALATGKADKLAALTENLKKVTKILGQDPGKDDPLLAHNASRKNFNYSRAKLIEKLEDIVNKNPSKFSDKKQPEPLSGWDKFVLFFEKNIILRIAPIFLGKPKAPPKIKQSQDVEEVVMLEEELGGSSQFKASTSRVLKAQRERQGGRARESVQREELGEKQTEEILAEEAQGKTTRLEGGTKSFRGKAAQIRKKVEEEKQKKQGKNLGGRFKNLFKKH